MGRYGKYVTDVHRPQDAFTLPIQVKGNKITYGYEKKEEEKKDEEKDYGKGRKRPGLYKQKNKGQALKDGLIFQVGRVCQVNYGPDVNKICVILDFVDSNKCLVTGPEKLTGVRRQVISFKRLSITPLKIKCSVGQGDTYITKQFKAAGIWEKWLKHPWYLKRQRELKRRNLTDFDRFKVMLLRQRKSQLIFRETLKLKEILRATNNGKSLQRTKKQLYWTAKRAGENPDYWKTKFSKTESEKNNRRKRSRSRKRSKKISAEKMASKKAYSRALRKAKALSKRKAASAIISAQKKLENKPARRHKRDMRILKKKKTVLELLKRKMDAKKKKKEAIKRIAKRRQEKAAARKEEKAARRAAGEKVSLRKAKKVAE